MSEIKHTDVLGQEIKVGSTVLHGSGGARGNYAGFSPQKVQKLTPKMITIRGVSIHPKNVVVIDKILEGNL